MSSLKGASNPILWNKIMIQIKLNQNVIKRAWAIKMPKNDFPVFLLVSILLVAFGLKYPEAPVISRPNYSFG